VVTYLQLVKHEQKKGNDDDGHLCSRVFRMQKFDLLSRISEFGKTKDTLVSVSVSVIS
jgi:hypothetical protein